MLDVNQKIFRKLLQEKRYVYSFSLITYFFVFQDFLELFHQHPLFIYFILIFLL